MYIICDVFGFRLTLIESVMGFIIFLYLFESYIGFRQRRKIVSSVTLPDALKHSISNEWYQKSRNYALDKSFFLFCNKSYSTLEWILFLYFSFIPWFWSKVLEHCVIINSIVKENVGLDLNLNSESEISCSVVFIFYCSVFMFFDSLPWDMYCTFVIEERYGFNKQTLGFFIKDRIKTFIVTMIIGLPLISVLIWIIKIGGQYFYFYASIFVLVTSIFMMFIYPEFIAPLFDRYENLPDGTLKDNIVALAESIKFPLKKLYVVEGSKRSAHSNAYFYGFGKNKRIVLYDTLIKGFKFPGKNDLIEESGDKGCSTDEVLAVLAHELGHWKLNHTIMHFVIGNLNLFSCFFVFSVFMNLEFIFTSFGFTGEVPILLRLIIIFQFILSPYNTVIDIVMIFVSRRCEFQADDFAVKLGYGQHLKTGLIALQKDNLSCPVYDWLYSMFTHSHPPLLERIDVVDSKCK